MSKCIAPVEQVRSERVRLPARVVPPPALVALLRRLVDEQVARAKEAAA